MSTTTTTGTPDESGHQHRTSSGPFYTIPYTYIDMPNMAPLPHHHAITITREQWRWWFAGQQMASYARLGHTEEKASRWAVRDADALLAELERTAP